MKSRKQISKEKEEHHTLADTLREEKKEHQDVHDERPDRMAPQSGIGRNYPGREGGSR